MYNAENICNTPEPEVYETDKANLLWEQFYKTTDKHKRKEIKIEYNALKNKIHKETGRKIYLSI